MSSDPDPEALLIQCLAILHAEISIGYSISIAAFFILLLLSALISGSEIAFFSIKGESLQEVKESKDKADYYLLQLLNNPRELLATILISNNFVNITIVILSTWIVSNLITFDNQLLQYLFQVVLVTFLIILFGEVTPKVYAQNNYLRVARSLAYPMYVLVQLLSPFAWMLVRSSRFFEKRIKKYHGELSIEELNEAIELTSDKETSIEEKNILKGIVNFGNTSVKQIMTSRHNIVAHPITTPFVELIQNINKHRYSRIPIYEESLDHITGILYVKDLLPFLGQDDFQWQTTLKKVYYVPEVKKIDDLLEEFQTKKVHLAIVADEYGGTQGLVTLEDILEEIVGEINDEFDDAEVFYSKLDDYNVVFDGKTALSDVSKVMNIGSESFEAFKNEVESIGGMMVEIAGRIPALKEIIRFKNFEFRIESVDNKRVRRVKMTVFNADQTTD